mmetsp:Transcript_8093/g.16877  ORF Transcript_8093/g.16877 Transcript_8093/m.16877 type:complete len:116 (+) Transcript_8093:419-766(+)
MKIFEESLSTDSEAVNQKTSESGERSVHKETGDKNSISRLPQTFESSAEVNVAIAGHNKKYQDQHILLSSGSPKSTAEDPEEGWFLSEFFLCPELEHFWATKLILTGKYIEVFSS